MAVVPALLTEALRGRYVIERELGHGGMATVYLAWDERHERRVALKVLRRELAAVLGRDRFLAEIRLTARLDHPGLLTLLDSGEAADTLYYVLPYAEGGSLRDRLNRERQLPIDEAIRIGREVAAALDYAHAHGIVHRDIKPENILLQEGAPKLTDFGIALAVREAGGERLTETGVVVGTPQYMSPEQATGDRLLDGRSDLYSLGAVVYEMLAGEPPVLGTTAQAIIARLMTERPTPLRVVRSTIPEELSRVVERALAKVPADRFASGAEFARSLATPAVLRPPRRRPSLALPAVAGAGVLASLALWWAIPRFRPVPPAPASVIAVLPPTTSTPDAALARLGRDLVFTLSPNLTGAGDIRGVDPEAVLARVKAGSGERSRDADLAAARRLGAGGVVRSTLVRVGPAVRWDLALLSSETGRLLAQATTTAPAESLRAFTDTATRALLQQIWLRGQPPSPSLDAAVKSRSVPALKAFLSGEADILAGRWDDGAHAYDQAIAADSTFWLAYWRLWYTSAYANVEVDTSLFQVAVAHRGELPDRERLLIEACTCVAGQLPLALRLAKQVTDRFPDDWFAWLFYSDYLVHAGPVLGYTAADARAALERTVALRPGLVDAWYHLLLVSLGRDTAATRQTLRALDPLGWMRHESLESGYDVRTWYRVGPWLDLSPENPSPVQVDSLVQLVLASDSAWGIGRSAFEALRWGYPRFQTAFDQRMLSSGVSTRFRPTYRYSLALAWAMRGAWDSALATVEQLADTDASEKTLMRRYLLATYGIWLGALDPVAAVGPGQAAHRAVASLPSDQRAEGERVALAWLDGLVALVRRDSPGLEAALAVLRRSRTTAAAYAERSLRGLRLGAAAGAGDSLTAADEGIAWDGRVPGISTQVLSINRLAEADAFLAVGDTAKATRALVWHEAELNGDNLPPQLFGPLAYLRLARIEQAQGLNAVAREHYRQFLRRYDHPVARLQPLVDEARKALGDRAGPDREAPAPAPTEGT